MILYTYIIEKLWFNYRFDDGDEDEDGFVTWLEYRRVEFDFDDDEDLESVKGGIHSGRTMNYVNSQLST